VRIYVEYSHEIFDTELSVTAASYHTMALTWPRVTCCHYNTLIIATATCIQLELLLKPILLQLNYSCKHLVMFIWYTEFLSYDSIIGSGNIQVYSIHFHWCYEYWGIWWVFKSELNICASTFALFRIHVSEIRTINKTVDKSPLQMTHLSRETMTGHSVFATWWTWPGIVI